MSNNNQRDGNGWGKRRLRGAGIGVLSLLLSITWSATGCNTDTRTDGEEPMLAGTTEALVAGDVPLLSSELLGRPTDRSVTVHVMAQVGVEALFEYGTVSGSYTGGTVPASYADGIVRAMIDGLAANTRYFYRMLYRPIGSAEPYITGTEHEFHTQRTRAETFRFAVQSDSHQGFAPFYSDALYGLTLANVLAGKPDFLIDLGDTFSLDGTGETEATVRQKYLAQRTSFAIASHSTPLFLVLGNHENEEGWNLDDFGTNVAQSLPVLGANARKRYFVNPVPDGFYTGNTDPLPAIDGDHLRENYYAFEWGNALFVAIDPFWYTTRKPFAGTMGGEKADEVVGNRWDWTLGRAQYDWLKATLENSTATFKFVFAHHLTGGTADYGRGGARGAKFCEWGGYDIDGVTWGFSTKRPDWPMPIHQLFVENGVSAFFHGHDHVFAKEELDGIVYQEVPHAANDDYGTGFGSNATDYAGGVILPNSGFVQVTVAPDNVLVEYVRSFLPGDGTNGEVAHAYTIQACSARDGDADGTNDCTDECPADPAKIAPGACGCGASDEDPDGDGTPSCNDLCPADATKIAPGACGCGVPDTDGNGNGTADCLETTCTGATLVSNDADRRARIGTTITFTASAACPGTATYQFRMRPPGGVFRTVRNYSTSPTHNWNTARLATGTYTFEVWARRSGSTEQYESRASATFTLTRF